MASKAEAYSEIVRAIAKILSGITVSLVSFITIAYTIQLSVPGDVVIVGGYEVVASTKLLISAVAISLVLLLSVCLTLSLLLLVDDENVNSLS